MVCLSEQEPRLWNWPKSAGLTRIGICFGCYQQYWETWKGFEFFIFWWSDADNLWTDRLCCVYILTYAIDSSCFIEQLITLLSVLITFGVFCNWYFYNLEVRTRIQIISSNRPCIFMVQGLLHVKLTHSTYTLTHTHTHTIRAFMYTNASTHTQTHTHTHRDTQVHYTHIHVIGTFLPT